MHNGGEILIMLYFKCDKGIQLKTRNLAGSAGDFTILLKCVAMCMVAHIVGGRFILPKLSVQISKLPVSIVERQMILLTGADFSQKLKRGGILSPLSRRHLQFFSSN